MKLLELVANDTTVNIRDLALDPVLAGDIQTRLIKLGCLDPPADGDFGPVSELVLREYAKQVGIPLNNEVNPDLAQSLLSNSEDTFLPLTLGTDFASRIVKYMRLKNYWVAKLPGFLNIVYIEDADEDGKPNKGERNKYNDRRIVLDIHMGKPRIKFNVLATTEPGNWYTNHPMNPKGAARIAFDQYKAWRVGIHYGGSSTGHEALRQVGVISVYRDINKDGIRTGDAIDVGSGFAINQHSGFNSPIGDIGRSSAGCLVGRLNNEHKDFMELVKTDPRYKEASKGYIFITTIIAGDKLHEMVD